MKCGLCRKSGHNRTTCPKNPPRAASGRLPQAPPNELLLMLISPSQALDLVVEKKTADALANATRQIGDMTRDGLGHLACSDILTALAELDLRAKQISPQMLSSLDASREAITRAHAALAAAATLHTRAKAEILFALGYRQQAATLGFIKPIEPVETAEVVEAEAVKQKQRGVSAQVPQHVAGLARAVDDHIKALLSVERADAWLTELALDGAVQAYYEVARLGDEQLQDEEIAVEDRPREASS